MKQKTQLKMSRGTQQICFQRRHNKSQQVHEKVLNITNYQENVNQNYNEISPHICQDESLKTKFNKFGNNVEKGNPCSNLWE